MDWQEQLISLYLYVCNKYEQKLWTINQRFTNYADLSFSDEEVIAIYLFGIIDGHRTIKKIYEYTHRHLRQFFPKLPSYVAFVQRLNKVSDIFSHLLAELQLEQTSLISKTPLLIDSFPVILAQQGRRFKAKVAPDIASSGYCATKKLFFYGVRVHLIGRNQPKTLPLPEYIGIYGAGTHDGKVFDEIKSELSGEILFGDKAYIRPDRAETRENLALTVLTPVKKQKGQNFLEAADQLLSTAVSKVRQPIESLFNWINEKTGIEYASKVRSSQGLLVHVFGRIAAAMFFWNYIRCA